MLKRFWIGLIGNDHPLIRHDNSEPQNLVSIPDNSEFIREGSGTTTVESVGQKVSLTIKDTGSLRITGNISAKCQILKEGKGTLTIDGVVANDLKLTMYGQGNVIFTQKPSDEVIDAIKKRSGTGEIICAGVTILQSSSGYIHHHLGQASGGEPSEPRRVRPIAPRPAARPSSSSSRSHAAASEDVDMFTKHTQDYIDSFSKQASIAERISELNLTEEEEPLFEKFRDTIITLDYYNSPPVRCNGRYYDVNGLLEWYNTKGNDPCEKTPLKLASIDDGRDMYEKLDKAILKLNKKREATKSAVVEESINEAKAPSP